MNKLKTSEGDVDKYFSVLEHELLVRQGKICNVHHNKRSRMHMQNSLPPMFFQQSYASLLVTELRSVC